MSLTARGMRVTHTVGNITREMAERFNGFGVIGIGISGPKKNAAQAGTSGR